jgi:tellurite resistance protein TerC
MVVLIWIGFIAFVLVMLALDLGVFNRKAHVITTREALRWTGLCVVLAMLFTAFVYFAYRHHLFGIGLFGPQPLAGGEAAAFFFQGYVVEMSLSLDNIFVIALIFAYFGVPRIQQHRVLFWGILGALVMRGAMIAGGTWLMAKFAWMIYLFGVLLIFTAFKMLFAGEGKVEPDRNPLVRLARRLYPVAAEFSNEKFFTRLNGKRAITPLFICLLVIESTDVLFAVDSIPAIFGITKDPFIVFTSNVFAILCLRSMYFALAGMLAYFHHLKYSLVALLFYVGVKMLISDVAHIPAWLSLAIIVALLAIGIIVSLLHPSSKEGSPPDDGRKPPGDDVGL